MTSITEDTSKVPITEPQYLIITLAIEKHELHHSIKEMNED